MAKKMTAEEVLEMEYALMAQYKKAEFQNKLHAAWNGAKGDQMEQMKRRQELTLPIQIPIITKYGFEGSKKGVAQSTAAVQSVPDQTEEMLKNHQVLMWLVDPDEQKSRPDFVPDAEIPEELKPVKPKIWAEDLVQRGSRWKVVGGGGKGGILVRKGKALDSAVYRFRLATGAIVLAESTITSRRLHYRKLMGDGPDFGWCSLVAPSKDAAESKPNRGLLLVPADIELSDELFDELADLTINAMEKTASKFVPPDLLALMN
mmetsp:Transcript_16475/g.38610  ORF Transcript_16475/g.38610 Transcript_16475/m.38610 type:complete len:261 (-) Transcript_16475:55-837(-)